MTNPLGFISSVVVLSVPVGDDSTVGIMDDGVAVTCYD